MTFSFGSVCSGIEAASCAWHEGLGWRAAFFSEIEAFPSAVLRVRWPGVPNLGDMTKFEEWPEGCRCEAEGRGRGELKRSELRSGANLNLPIYVCSSCGGIAIDLLVGGTPCQSFSVAGLREGLDDARGRLMLTFVELLARYRPRWFVWENVPGVFSSAGGADFAAFLGAVTGREICVPRAGWGNTGIVEGIEDAYGACWRTLDAQYFGVAQRRRRVFVVGHLGGQWQRAAAVLLERSGLRGDPAPRREAGKGVAGSLAARTRGGGGLGTDLECDGGLVAFGGNNTSGPIDVANALQRPGRFDFESETFVAGALQASGKAAGSATQQDAESGMLVPIGFNARQDPDAWEGRSGPLDTDGCTQAVAIGFSGRARGAEPKVNRPERPPLAMIERTGALETVKPWHVATGMAVRRLTPRECERLQGFADDYTLIRLEEGVRKRVEADFFEYLQAALPGISREEAEKLAKDGPRYRALGNAMAVPVMRWIGERIARVEELLPATK